MWGTEWCLTWETLLPLRGPSTHWALITTVQATPLPCEALIWFLAKNTELKYIIFQREMSRGLRRLGLLPFKKNWTLDVGIEGPISLIGCLLGLNQLPAGCRVDNSRITRRCRHAEPFGAHEEEGSRPIFSVQEHWALSSHVWLVCRIMALFKAIFGTEPNFFFLKELEYLKGEYALIWRKFSTREPTQKIFTVLKNGTKKQPK